MRQYTVHVLLESGWPFFRAYWKFAIRMKSLWAAFFIVGNRKRV
jgi:hypothetical protein